MSWCGRCFTGQAISESETDDDGEYEYFVNSHYICKRKKTNAPVPPCPVHPQIAPAVSQGKAESSPETTTISTTVDSSSTSQISSSSLSSYLKGQTGFSKTDETSQTSSWETDKKSTIDAAQLIGARIWQVGHATINSPVLPYDPYNKPYQTLNAPSTSGSDRTTEIVFNQSSHKDSPTTVLSAPLSGQDKALATTKISTPPSAVESIISCSSGQTSKLKNRPGFIRRLFGRSGKSVFSRKTGGASQSSSFKESMEQPSPAIATSTLYWTVRVKMK
ncbi:hypothetical protein GE061_009622 [Apolygus lucorum]|uniref:Uncharacterized protein n=1 Tax=Apolygus lucorum TaxID=248454 RepID=A0A8S9Y2S0_APOLU|nr:hypothetical protein GE061_009622 [Apolygus lucorum]